MVVSFSSRGLNTINTGGLLPPERSPYIATDQTDASDPRVIITLDFDGFAGGVTGVEFTIFGLDAALSFEDEVKVTALTT